MELTMVRWYDYVFAFVAAETARVNFFNVFAPDTWIVMSLFSAAAFYAIFCLWDDYCIWRRKKEREKG